MSPCCLSPYQWVYTHGLKKIAAAINHYQISGLAAVNKVQHNLGGRTQQDPRTGGSRISQNSKNHITSKHQLQFK
jgi:hypothetical protein